MLTSANSSEIDPIVKACLTLNEDISVRSIDGKVALKIFVVYVTKMKKLVRYIRFGFLNIIATSIVFFSCDQ